MTDTERLGEVEGAMNEVNPLREALRLQHFGRRVARIGEGRLHVIAVGLALSAPANLSSAAVAAKEGDGERAARASNSRPVGELPKAASTWPAWLRETAGSKSTALERGGARSPADIS